MRSRTVHDFPTVSALYGMTGVVAVHSGSGYNLLDLVARMGDRATPFCSGARRVLTCCSRCGMTGVTASISLPVSLDCWRSCCACRPHLVVRYPMWNRVKCMALAIARHVRARAAGRYGEASISLEGHRLLPCAECSRLTDRHSLQGGVGGPGAVHHPQLGRSAAAGGAWVLNVAALVESTGSCSCIWLCPRGSRSGCWSTMWYRPMPPAIARWMAECCWSAGMVAQVGT